MGAAAGVRFLDTLVKQCQRGGAREDYDFPEVVLFSLSSAGMDETGIVDAELMKRDLLKAIEILNRCDVNVILIACNTVHVFLEELQKYSSAGIVSMPEEAIRIAGDRKIAVLSSRTTAREKVYRKQDVFCTREQQTLVDGIIGRVIGGRNDFNDSAIMDGIISDLFRRGAECVVIGCTELPIVTPSRDNVIDAGECAVRKALQSTKLEEGLS